MNLLTSVIDIGMDMDCNECERRRASTGGRSSKLARAIIRFVCLTHSFTSEGYFRLRHEQCAPGRLLSGLGSVRLALTTIELLANEANPLCGNLIIIEGYNNTQLGRVQWQLVIDHHKLGAH